LTGKAGQTIKETVTLSPSPADPFTITEIRAEKGDHIRYEVLEIKQPDRLKYQLTIFNTKREPGWYIDKIFVKTTSRVTPEFKISVMGVIRGGT